MHPIDEATSKARQNNRTGRRPYLSDNGPNMTCSNEDATIKSDTESCIMEKEEL